MQRAGVCKIAGGRAALHKRVGNWLQGGRRRATGGRGGEQRAFDELLDGDRGSGVGQARRAGNRQRMRIGSELTRRAGHAVLRRLEMADEIVMLERRADEHGRVECDADDRQRPGARGGSQGEHLIDDTLFNGRLSI